MTEDMSTPVRRVNVGASPEPSLFECIGAEKVERLVVAFYARVDSDPVIRPLYGKTLSCAIRGLTDFMITWLGGPPVYDLPAARLRRSGNNSVLIGEVLIIGTNSMVLIAGTFHPLLGKKPRRFGKKHPA